MNIVVLSFASLVWVAGLARAAPFHFQSGTQQVSLLELYTSEGCSSCPPAETWLNRLQGSPDLWRLFVPVEFHVDYWNSTGWKEQWAAPEYSERQRNYAQAWNAGNVYTPCFVLNGMEWRGWLFRRSVPNSAGVAAGVLTVSSTDTNLWTATFIPANQTGSEYEIYASLQAIEFGSDVKGGENVGRHLRHEFVVMKLVQTKMVTRQGVARARFVLDFPRSEPQHAGAISIWVTRAGGLEPLQATGGWLAPPDSAR